VPAILTTVVLALRQKWVLHEARSLVVKKTDSNLAERGFGTDGSFVDEVTFGIRCTLRSTVLEISIITICRSGNSGKAITATLCTSIELYQIARRTYRLHGWRCRGDTSAFHTSVARRTSQITAAAVIRVGLAVNADSVTVLESLTRAVRSRFACGEARVSDGRD